MNSSLQSVPAQPPSRSRYRRMVMRFGGAVQMGLLASVMLVLGGCPANPADCQRQLCEAMAVGDSTVITAATTCCAQEAPAARDACRQSLVDKLFAIRTKVIELKAACETGNRELYIRLWEELKKIIRGAGVRQLTAAGSYVNTVPLLFADDSVRLWLSFVVADQPTAIDSVEVANRRVVPSATGEAVARQLAQGFGSTATVNYITKDQAAAEVVSRYSIAPGSSVDLYVAGRNFSMPVSGAISVGALRAHPDLKNRALISELTLTTTIGQDAVVLRLDDKFENNYATFDADGAGATITAALNMETKNEAIDSWRSLYDGTVVRFRVVVDPATGVLLGTDPAWQTGTGIVPIAAADLSRDFAAMQATDSCKAWVEEIKQQMKELQSQLGCPRPPATGQTATPEPRRR